MRHGRALPAVSRRVEGQETLPMRRCPGRDTADCEGSPGAKFIRCDFAKHQHAAGRSGPEGGAAGKSRPGRRTPRSPPHTHWNFSWLTAGATNRIDISREAGAGALLVSAGGRRYALANAIEMPRLADEVLAGLDFEPIEFAWVDERANPAFLVQRATALLSGPIGCRRCAWRCAPLRNRLCPGCEARSNPKNCDAIRALGADAGRAVGSVLQSVPAGISEREVVREVAISLLRANTRPLVLLAAADNRLLRHRHPIPTALVWADRLMVAVCAERDGLVVALSRLLSAGRPDGRDRAKADGGAGRARRPAGRLAPWSLGCESLSSCR